LAGVGEFGDDTIVVQPQVAPKLTIGREPLVRKERHDRQKVSQQINQTSPLIPARQERQQRTRAPPSRYEPEPWSGMLAMTAIEVHEPTSLMEALSGNEKEQWKLAWKSELESLEKNNTWVLEGLPEGRKAIGCRWIFKIKDDGRFKARLVAKGYAQRVGIDYEETFAPVAKFTSVRVLLALVAESNWELYGMDVKTAFLNGELRESEKVYMEVPEGLEVPITGMIAKKKDEGKGKQKNSVSTN
jgi:hypothetical protein